MSDLINPVLLDPDVEGWVEEAIEVVRVNTDLTEFDVHSPELTFIELMVYHREQLANRINLVPRQLLIDFLNYVQFTPRTGLKAVGSVTFTITTQTTGFEIPSGYLLTDGSQIFQTTQKLSIAAGDLTGTVPVICTENGTQGNVGAGTINQAIGIKYPQVTSINNNSPLTGGTDEETDDEAIERSVLSYNTREALVTAADFRNALKSYGGLAIKVLPATNELFQEEINSILLLTYGLDATQRDDFLLSIEDRVAIGVTVYIGELPVKPLEIEVDMRISSGQSPGTITQSLFDLLTLKYSPVEDQEGQIWVSQINSLALSVPGVVATTGISFVFDGVSLPLNTDFPVNPTYAAVELTKLTVNTDDGYEQIQTIIEA